MTIEKYAEAILPLIKECYEDGNERSHLWYLYRQAFYGFTEFIDQNAKIRVSGEAARAYRLIAPSGDLHKMTWVDQPTFDKGRQIFILEHVYTGEMFRSAVKELYEKNDLTQESLVELIRKDYCVAWILK